MTSEALRTRLVAALLAGALCPLALAPSPVQARGPIPWDEFDRLLEKAKKTAPRRPAWKIPAVTVENFPGRVAGLESELARDAQEAGRLAALLDDFAGRTSVAEAPAGVEIFRVRNDLASLRERIEAAGREARALAAFAGPSGTRFDPAETIARAEELRDSCGALAKAAGRAGPSLEALGSQSYVWSRSMRVDSEASLKAAEELQTLWR